MTPTSTMICLVRHGETDWNLTGFTQGTTDVPLNDTGRRQAADVGRALAGSFWDVLVASPLSRTMETAEIIGGYIGIEHAEPISNLVERDYGIAEGMATGERKSRFADKIIPEAEPWDAVEQRSLHAAHTIVDRYRGRRIVAVAHGGTILTLLAQISDGKYSHKTVVLENAGMTMLEYTGTWTVHWCNRTADSATLSLS